MSMSKTNLYGAKDAKRIIGVAVMSLNRIGVTRLGVTRGGNYFFIKKTGDLF